MDIGLLNEKVTFQKNTVITDSIGNHKNGWEDFGPMSRFSTN